MDTRRIGDREIPDLKLRNDPKVGNSSDKGEKRVGKGDAGGNSDWKVQISPNSRMLAQSRMKALEIARSTPEIREEKVQELKEKIAKGEYKPEAGDIADGMLREAIRDYFSNERGLSMDDMG